MVLNEFGDSIINEILKVSETLVEFLSFRVLLVVQGKVCHAYFR
ncbi:unnamed protein product, partial [marine sediment metagenome]